MKVTCPNCKAILKLKNEPKGPSVRIKCPKCSTPFTFAKPAEAPPAPEKHKVVVGHDSEDFLAEVKSLLEGHNFEVV